MVKVSNMQSSPPSIPASAPLRPSAEQVTIQLLEAEVANYRRQLGAFVVRINELTDELAGVTKERDECNNKAKPEP
jgi:hypothetical protein